MHAEYFIYAQHDLFILWCLCVIHDFKFYGVLDFMKLSWKKQVVNDGQQEMPLIKRYHWNVWIPIFRYTNFKYLLFIC